MSSPFNFTLAYTTSFNEQLSKLNANLRQLAPQRDSPNMRIVMKATEVVHGDAHAVQLLCDVLL